MKAITIILLFLGGGLWAQPQIVGAEYFFNNDPGPGNGVNVDVTPGNTQSLSFTAAATDLEEGINNLYVRVVNSEGTWSVYGRKPFAVVDFPPITEIVAAEWFFNDDPGVGEGNALNINPGNPVSVSVAIPMGDLGPGMHVLQIRVKNAAEKWSLFGRKLFYVLPAYIPGEIIAAEYYIDGDPGLGGGTPLVITPGLEIEETFQIELSDTLSQGDHLLNIRVMNEDETWSMVANALFTIDGEVGVRDISGDFGIFPNPTRGIVHVRTNHKIESMRLLDLSGKAVLTADPAIDYAPELSTTGLELGAAVVRAAYPS